MKRWGKPALITLGLFSALVLPSLFLPWILKYVSALLLLFNTQVEFAFRKALKDETSPTHEAAARLRHGLLSIVGIIAVVVLALNDLGDSKRRVKEENQRSALIETQAVLIATIDQLNRNTTNIVNQLASYGEQLHDLSLAIATNPIPNPTVLQALTQARQQFSVLESDVADLTAKDRLWRAKQEQLRLKEELSRASNVNRDREWLDDRRTLFNSIVNRAASQFQTISKRANVPFHSTLQSLPLTASKPLDLGTIRVGSNPATCLSCQILVNDNGGPYLRLVYCESADNAPPPYVDFAKEGGDLWFWYHIPPQPTFGERFSYEEYTNLVPIAVDYLIGARVKHFPGPVK